MLKKPPVYRGEEGYKTLTEHMKMLQFERKQGGDAAGHQIAYFQGMLHGLNLLNAIGGDINTALYDFVLKDQGFNDLPEAVRNAGEFSPYLADRRRLEAAGLL